ncbi:MAG: DUF6044 family protein [candidate division KSB1 bacterium]|nr:DUF6044 family protein [candidate division KSB1 bacterium]
MKKYIKQFVNNISISNLFLFGLVFIFIYYLPYIIFGENSWFNFGYDSLDSNVIWNIILTESGKIFTPNNEIIPQAMSGLPRASYPGEFSIELLLYFIFKPIHAYIANIILIAIFAYVGMFFLLKTLSPKLNIFILTIVSILYALLPFWPHGGLGVAGLPLIIFGLINVKLKPILSYAVLVFYVLYSSFVLTGIFLIAILGVFLLLKWMRTKKFPLPEIAFVVVMFILHMATNYRLILSSISPEFVSHRSSTVMPTHSLTESYQFFINLLFGEWGHNIIIKIPIIISLVFLILGSLLVNRNHFKKYKNIYYTGLIIIGISFLAVLFQNKYFYNFYTGIFPFLKQIQMQRFYWLLPPFFYILYFFVLNKLVSYKFGKIIVVLIFIMHLGFVFEGNSMYRQLLKTKVLNRKAGVISWKRFYSEDLYEDIDDYIRKDKSTYRVASIGLQPGVALYNGFYTVDGYFSNYPLQYKKQIYDIIKPELKKDSSLYKFFVDWGSVCVIPSSELINRKYGPRGYVIPKIYKRDSITKPIQNLNIRTKVLKSKLNCQYIFVAAEIGNSDQLGLEYHKKFENKTSPYRIYLYEIE